MRERMVETQIRARDVQSAAVLDAMRRVPRHLFVPDDLKPFAYDDRPLPIGRDLDNLPALHRRLHDRRVAARAGAHRPRDRHGLRLSGRDTRRHRQQVYSVEIVADLAENARRAIEAAGYTNVEVRTGNGYLGWPDHAPFDRVIVTAAPPEIPEALVDQLAVGGVMVVPVGTANQEIVVITKTPAGIVQKRTIEVRFVPMVSKPKEP